jgi:hypothetical protein
MNRNIVPLIAILIIGSCCFYLGMFYQDNNVLLRQAIHLKRLDNLSSPELPSPSQRINYSDIDIYDDKIVIHVINVTPVVVTDTNSMDPVMDIGMTMFQIKPKDENDIHIGDIIAAKFPSGDIVVHRVVSIDWDEQGWYIRTKGDNNNKIDSTKIRFKDITGIHIGVIY